MQENAGGRSALDLADDAFLVARARDGDVRAFGTLLRRHDRTLRRYIDRLLRSRSDTEDVLQETALIAWRRLDGLQEPAKVRAWLIQIATREAIRVSASQTGYDELADDTIVVAGPDASAERLDLQRDLRDALDGLPQQQARCWVLRELGGYRYSEIAQELDIPESTVRGSLAQARKSILSRLGGRR